MIIFIFYVWYLLNSILKYKCTNILNSIKWINIIFKSENICKKKKKIYYLIFLIYWKLYTYIFYYFIILFKWYSISFLNISSTILLLTNFFQKNYIIIFFLFNKYKRHGINRPMASSSLFQPLAQALIMDFSLIHPSIHPTSEGEKDEEILQWTFFNRCILLRGSLKQPTDLFLKNFSLYCKKQATYYNKNLVKASSKDFLMNFNIHFIWKNIFLIKWTFGKST